MIIYGKCTATGQLQLLHKKNLSVSAFSFLIILPTDDIFFVRQTQTNTVKRPCCYF